MMTAKIDRLLFQVLRHGPVGALGVALIAASLLFDGLVLRPLESQYDALVERNALAAIAMPVKSADLTGRATRAVAETADATLRQMFAAAHDSGLSLDQGDYQLSRGQEDGQVRYQLTLPVEGTYIDIRDFIGQMLNDDPALALASVTLTRTAIEDQDVEATLQFVLYLRGQQ